MDKRQKRRAEYKSWKKGYYHLCTDGKKGTICHDEAEYVYLVNTISLLDLMFPVKVHFYEVMRSHVHLLLSGRGGDCVAVFDYVRSRINKRLVTDGHPPLPADYDFKLIPVVDEDQMRNNGIYIARNASEVLNILPGRYLFGSSMAFYSDLPRLFETVRAGDLSVRTLRKLFQTHVSIPPDRLIHPGRSICRNRRPDGGGDNVFCGGGKRHRQARVDDGWAKTIRTLQRRPLCLGRSAEQEIQVGCRHLVTILIHPRPHHFSGAQVEKV